MSIQTKTLLLDISLAKGKLQQAYNRFAFVCEKAAGVILAGYSNKGKEFILHSILLSALCLLTIYDSSHAPFYLGSVYRNILPVVFLSAIALFLVFYVLSLTKYFTLFAYVLVTALFIAISRCAYRWGPDMPLVLLGYALLVLVASMLVSPKLSLFLFFVAIFYIAWFSYQQIHAASVLPW